MKYISLLALILLISTVGMAQVVDSTQVAQPEETKIVKPKLDKSKIYYGG